MRRLRRRVRQFIESESAATATEYAVMIALVIVILISVVATIGTKVSGYFADAEKGW